MNRPTLQRRAIRYPETDGLPMAENTLQFRWIVKIKEGIEALFRDDPNVFVAGDLFWYPVEGDNKTRTAPDAMVVFGRPKGDRPSYMQWVEAGIAPQVVFEVLSPGNRFSEMLRKFHFYQDHGVEEYYVYDPDKNNLDGWIRENEALRPKEKMNGWVSPRLGIRFDWTDDGLRLVRPDGRPLETYEEVDLRAKAAEEAALAERERARMEAERARAAVERAQAADARAQAADERVARLAAKLRALGIDSENGQEADPGAG